MTTVAEHKREGIGKYLVVYLCILALAGLQFVIAYQNIHAGANVPAHVVGGLGRGWSGRHVLHAFVVGKAGIPVVCSGFYNFCAAHDAVWLD